MKGWQFALLGMVATVGVCLAVAVPVGAAPEGHALLPAWANATAEGHAYTYDGRQWIVVPGDVGGADPNLVVGGVNYTTLPSPSDTPKKAADGITVTVTYDHGKTLTIQGPQNEAFCVARREALMLKADKITIPAGTYPANCEDTQTSWVMPGVALTPTYPLDIEPPK